MNSIIKRFREKGNALLSIYKFRRLEKSEKEGVDFAALPLELYINGRLKDAELRIYAVLIRSANKDGYGFMGFETIANYLHFSERTVKRAMNSLNKKGFIVKGIVELDNNKNKCIYAPTYTYDWVSRNKIAEIKEIEEARTGEGSKPGQVKPQARTGEATSPDNSGALKNRREEQKGRTEGEEPYNRGSIEHGDEPQFELNLLSYHLIDALEYEEEYISALDEEIEAPALKDEVEQFIFLHSRNRKNLGKHKMDYSTHILNLYSAPLDVVSAYIDSDGWLIQEFEYYCNHNMHLWESNQTDRSPSVMVKEDVYRRFMYWMNKR